MFVMKKHFILRGLWMPWLLGKQQTTHKLLSQYTTINIEILENVNEPSYKPKFSIKRDIRFMRLQNYVFKTIFLYKEQSLVIK